MTSRKTKQQNVAVNNYRLSTDEFAEQHLVLPQTVRKQYAATGSYFGVRPIKLPNRRLLWPANAVEQLIGA